MYLHNKDRTDFDQKSQELRFLVQNLSLKYFRNRSVDFYFEIEGLIQAIEREINTYCLSHRGGIDILQREIDYLNEQDFQLTANIAKLYIIVQKEKKEQTQQIILKQVGFVGGGAQFFAGVGLCAGTLGAACAGYGVPMMVHGANNTYENGYYLVLREETSGTVRDAYRYTADKLGFNNNQADLVYGAIDLGMTGYGSFRKILLPREKSWKLFQQIKQDYILGWQEMSAVAISTDAVSSAVTAYSLYQVTGGGK
ncbi:DUF4225 domain-containing protein [Brenneria corticis]|uniref:DUF4225 domain-containing protein n=1 Tax=Brenneria corticis TaxID=2173106 RepID=A0A2U1U6T7_9GAMM|nr:DUF4225 domain-containing protein [Brenneria sp. CFCC 11842]PWC17359.1 hypothetical protein DDT56_07505 [Brenneria sp. CFCC 11842]